MDLGSQSRSAHTVKGDQEGHLKFVQGTLGDILSPDALSILLYWSYAYVCVCVCMFVGFCFGWVFFFRLFDLFYSGLGFLFYVPVC